MPKVTDPALLSALGGAPMGGPAPSGGGIPTFQVPQSQQQISAEQRAQSAEARANAAAGRDAAGLNLRVQEANKPPAGYTWTPQGTLAPIPGGPADPAAKAEKQGSTGNLDSIIGQINRVQELYSKGFKDEAFGIMSSLGEMLPTGANAQFDTAGAGLAEQGLAAFRVPGQGSQSDLEASMFAKANTPQASDFDLAIEEKLNNLRGRVDANRAAAGLPPANWGGASSSADQDQAEVPPGAATPPGSQPPSPTGPQGDGGITGSREPGTLPLGPGPETAAGFGQGVEDDPQLAGVKEQYRARLEAGQGAGEIVQYLRSVGITDPRVIQSAVQQVAFRKKYPQVPIGNYSIEALDDRAIPQSTAREWTNWAADSSPGTFAMNAGDAVTGFSLDSMTDNPELTRAGMANLNARNPGSALAGQALGGGLAVAGLEAGLARYGMQSAVGRGLAADVAYGAGAGAGASDDNRVLGAGVGALAGVGGNMAGRGLTKAFGGTVGGVADPAVRAVADEGTPLTLGQAVGQSGVAGQAIKGLEDRAAGLPGVGDVINARRASGLEKWNSKMFDRALKSIDGNVGGAVGVDAMQAADQAVSQAYTRALAGKAVTADQPFQQQLTQSVTNVVGLPRVGNEVANSVQEILSPYLTGQQLTGDAMQQISRELQALKKGYGTDPLASRIGKSIDGVEDSVFGLFRRQAPEVLPAYNKAKAAARRLYILEDAVLAGNNRGGVFTPAQLGRANISGTKRFGGKRAASTGRSPFHDSQQAAQAVLPNQVPDSGTAGRLAVLAAPAALGGTGAGVGYAAGDPQSGAVGGLSLAAALSLAYTKAGQRALVGAVTKRSPGFRAAGKAIDSQANRVGTISGGAAVPLIVNQ